MYFLLKELSQISGHFSMIEYYNGILFPHLLPLPPPPPPIIFPLFRLILEFYIWHFVTTITSGATSHLKIFILWEITFEHKANEPKSKKQHSQLTGIMSILGYWIIYILTYPVCNKKLHPAPVSQCRDMFSCVNIAESLLIHSCCKGMKQVARQRRLRNSYTR